MNKEIKNKIIQIIIAAILFGFSIFIDKMTNFTIWIDMLIYLLPYLVAGKEVLKEAIENMLHGEFFDEDFLMTIATIGAFAIGFLPGASPEFTEAVFVMLLFQIGELFEEIAEGKSEKSISALLKIRPDYANIEKNGKVEKISPEEVKINEIIVIKPGEKIPMDGIIVDGKSTLNTTALTGESVPREVIAEDMVYSGCINLSGTIKVRVTKEFSESTASKIIELVQSASEKKSKSENFITKFSRVYTPIVVIGALLLAILPPLFTGNFVKNFGIWLQRALTFLVVSCPCALVISVPLSFFGGIGGAAKKGILIKGSKDLESLSKVKTIVFDKTGTLTEGVFEVSAIHPEVYDEERLLHLAAHVERYSTHPIAISLKKAYKNEDDQCKVTDVEEIAGQGIKAKVNGNTLFVGNKHMMEKLGFIQEHCEKCPFQGTVVHVADEKKYLGHIVISDKVKDDSKRALKELKIQKINTVMLTGDYENVANNVAKELEIKEYFAELLPQDKLKKLENIITRKNNQGLVAFVGDGINDSPALARADVGIAMGALGSDSAIEAADIVLMDDSPSKIFTAIKSARKTMKIARQNIIFAIFIKLAVLVLATFGYAPMWLAVFADVGVTVIAVFNAMRTLK